MFLIRVIIILLLFYLALLVYKKDYKIWSNILLLIGYFLVFHYELLSLLKVIESLKYTLLIKIIFFIVIVFFIYLINNLMLLVIDKVKLKNKVSSFLVCIIFSSIISYFFVDFLVLILEVIIYFISLFV